MVEIRDTLKNPLLNSVKNRMRGKEDTGVHTGAEWWAKFGLELSRRGREIPEVLRDKRIDWET